MKRSIFLWQTNKKKRKPTRKPKGKQFVKKRETIKTKKAAAPSTPSKRNKRNKPPQNASDWYASSQEPLPSAPISFVENKLANKNKK
jgi:hypothetical protein